MEYINIYYEYENTSGSNTIFIEIENDNDNKNYTLKEHNSLGAKYYIIGYITNLQKNIVRIPKIYENCKITNRYNFF